MTSNAYNGAFNDTIQELESPQTSIYFDSSLPNARRTRSPDLNNDEKGYVPIISFATENQENESRNQSLSIKPLIIRMQKAETDEFPTRNRRRFMSCSEPQNTTDDERIQSLSGNRNTYQTDADSLETRNENESPERSLAKRNSMRPLRPSRFRKLSYDCNDTSKDSNKEQSETNSSEKKRKLSKLGATANALLKKVTSPGRPRTISLTFDAFVDKQKGVETIKSNYPKYKTDKRLIFLGMRFKYPTFVIPYTSTFRKSWDFFIILVMIYEVFWFPLALSFFYNQESPESAMIINFILYPVFFVDLMVNLRTTYSNENNEEIIDLKMIRKSYMKKSYFFIDVINLIPISEILLYSFPDYEYKYLLYSVFKLLRFLRITKLGYYSENLHFNDLFKLLKIFVGFFLMVHWVSCVWFLIIKFEHSNTQEVDKIWFPNNSRMIVDTDQDLFDYYNKMTVSEVYSYTMLALFMLVVGSDVAPVTLLQVYFTVVIGLVGAISLAYVFGLVTFIINRRNENYTQYKQQLEALKQKLRINKVPENLKTKVLEYFNYTWRKHRVLYKLNDFSELSLPLQRDLAFYQNQKIVTKLPLFQELEPLEVLSIIQKLKICVYMPGDKIIRDGERGTEMYFIQEGIVEIVIKTTNPQSPGRQESDFHKIYLEKESYFGESALMSNSKRIFDANAYEFCILESFSRQDYLNLKKEFPDIGPRLKSGLKYYKTNRRDQIMALFKNIPIFVGFTDDELKILIDDYTEEVFIDANRIILRPKEKTNALYFVFLGHVNCYADDQDTKDYLAELKKVAKGDKLAVIVPEEEDELKDFDDDILDLEKDKLSIEDQKKKLKLIEAYTFGGYFGSLDFQQNETQCEHFYVSDSACQLGAITQNLLEDMAESDPNLYTKLRKNIVRSSPKKDMVAIQEETESVVSTSLRNSFAYKHLKPHLESSSKIEMSKSSHINITNAPTNLDQEFSHFKGQFSKLQAEVDSLKMVSNDIASKLSLLLSQSDTKQSGRSTRSNDNRLGSRNDISSPNLKDDDKRPNHFDE